MESDKKNRRRAVVISKKISVLARFDKTFHWRIEDGVIINRSQNSVKFSEIKSKRSIGTNESNEYKQSVNIRKRYVFFDTNYVHYILLVIQ